MSFWFCNRRAVVAERSGRLATRPVTNRPTASASINSDPDPVVVVTVQFVLVAPRVDEIGRERGLARIVSVVPSPPSGTVTFLFTDIERSTQLWESADVSSGRPVGD